jgi:hypothetical protein
MRDWIRRNSEFLWKRHGTETGNGILSAYLTTTTVYSALIVLSHWGIRIIISHDGR